MPAFSRGADGRPRREEEIPTGKFWSWTKMSARADGDAQERVLRLSGTIAEESWFGDEATPALFREELNAGQGAVTVWINSPGGDCVAAAQIYNMLMDYKGFITVKIDGIAASAASVIAMAGSRVLMSPVSMMMIHNPATIAFGDAQDMRRAVRMLSEVKESIINAYEIKTGMTRERISRLMDEETWMDARKAVELGFADGILQRESDDMPDLPAMLHSRAAVANSLMGRLAKQTHAECRTPGAEPDGQRADEFRERLRVIRKYI